MNPCIAEAFRKLKEKELCYGKPGDNFYSSFGKSGLVKIEDVERIIEEMEVDMLNYFDNVLNKESKNPPY